MPIERVDGGFRWGGHGHVYPTREGAERQAAAAHAHGFTGDELLTAAGVLCRTPDGLVLFLKRADEGDGDAPGLWAFPGGGLEVAEDAQSGAARELLEETGYVADALQEVHRQVLDGVDFTTFVHEAREQFEPRLNDEHTEYVWMSPQAAPQPLHPGVAATLAAMNSGTPAMDKIAADKLAFDRASVRTYDQDGRLRVEMTNISKATVNPYLGSEIPDGDRLGLDPKRVYQLLRDPEELAKAAETFNGVPLLDTHIPSTAWDHPKGKVVGTTGTDAVFEAPYLKNSLIVWTQDAIQGIESGEQRELSCGYRYRADMTPGTYDGVQYDGVMRDIRGNHVALVAAGRAGPDVVVGDSQLEIKETGMTKKSLSSKAHTARGALMATLKPLLAADAKLDLPAILQGVTAKNWKDSKAKIVAAIKPKIAADADIQEIVKLLDSLDDIEDAGDDTPDPNAAKPAPAIDADPMEELAGMLKGKVDDATLSAVLDKCKAMMAKPAAGAADEPPEPGKKEDMVSKAAMDAALARAAEESAKAIKLASDTAARETEQRTIARLQEIDAAREFAKGIVGTLAGAFDSAEAVYRAALDTKGVKHQEVKDVAALRLILEAQPKPGMAQDSRHNPNPQGFAERFPGAATVRSV